MSTKRIGYKIATVKTSLTLVEEAYANLKAEAARRDITVSLLISELGLGLKPKKDKKSKKK